MHPIGESEGAEECHSLKRQPTTRDEWLAVPVQGVLWIELVFLKQKNGQNMEQAYTLHCKIVVWFAGRVINECSGGNLL